MGVYINMEMPKSCVICPFSKTNDDLMPDDYRFRYCDFPYIGEFVTDYEESRHPDCPLVPVPPHGKLIESKAFLKVAYETDDFSLDEFAHLAVLVAATPTIIPADDPKEE